ncbi:MAG: arginine--tRNA ligase [Clostridiales bacterium]|nr:arginine--tRNA ligase [Clostridiales bacterium]
MDYKKIISETINIEGVSQEEIISSITLPKDLSLGDFALPCFKFAKALHKAPNMIAEDLAKLDYKGAFEKVEAVNGYLNFKVDKKVQAKQILDEVIEKGNEYGKSNIGAGKTICIDFSSVNIAKPFHMGHMLNTSIGSALYKIYKELGYNAIGINHLGDWGTQFGKLIVAYKKWGNKEDIEARGVRGLLDIYVKFHKEAEVHPELEDEARHWFKNIEDGNKEALDLFYWFKDITLKEVDKIYKRLDVTFDSYAGESFYNDKMDAVVEELEQKKLLTDSEGAKVVMFEDDKMPPCIIKKSDGATLYATRDLAAVFYRKKTYNFDKCLYVVAYQQNLHFKQWFKVVEMMGYDWAKDLYHVAHGMVSLENGALSTREGNVVFLEDVLNTCVEKAKKVIEEKNPNLENKDEVAEQVGVGAVIFAMLYNSRIKDITFSEDKVLSFEGETGPYVQYTYARCNSLLEKCGDVEGDIDFEGINNDAAAEVIRTISKYQDTLMEASERFEPYLVTRFVVELAQGFNKFYFDCNIANAEQGIKNARLLLTKAVKQVLQNALKLLGIQTPKKM